MIQESNSQGLVIVITGNGKGKTTAALGQAVRALGYGCKVFFLQFMKGKPSGELAAVKNYLPGIEMQQTGSESWVLKKENSEANIHYAQQGLEKAKAAIYSGEYALVVLDEMNVVLDYNLLPVSGVVDMIVNRPRHVSVILTGRNAPPQIIEIADIASSIEEIKHPYNKGVAAQKGIEY
jgi:cob(I)alamin adenosyltransferase